MKAKRLLSLALAVVLSASMFIGCAAKDEGATPSATASKGDDAKKDDKKDTGPVALTLWGSAEDQAMLEGMVKTFKEANPDTTYEIKLGVVGEPDAKTKYLEDPSVAADVFAFANDQLYDLVNAGALYEVTKNKDAIIAANIEGAVDASTANDKLYAYPMTADNGYFMYYDKSVISEEDVKSLDTMLAAADAKGKKIFMDVSNGWYIASFFLSGEGELGIKDGVQTCNFNSAQGVLIGEAIKSFTAHKAFMTGDDAVLTGEMGGKIAAGVSGTWNADAIKEKLGENYAATKLPTVTIEGKQVQMSSFAGYKLVGVNSVTKNPVEAMKLAEWITNEENQLIRFNTRAMGPSNKVVADSADVKANVALAGLAAQMEFAVSQKDVLGGFWGPAEAFGTAMEAKDYSKTIKEQLDAMVAQIVAPVA